MATPISIRDVLDKANADPFFRFFYYVGPPYPNLISPNNILGRVPFAKTIKDIIRHTPDGALVTMPLEVVYQSPTEPDTFIRYDFPNEPLIQVVGSHSIVKTDIVGSSETGTIKEEMGINDWRVTIRGFIVNNDDDTYPEEQVREMKAMLTSRRSLDILTSPFLEHFDINGLAVESYRFIPQAGFLQVQPYEIVCSSDNTEAEVLKLLKQENDIQNAGG